MSGWPLRTRPGSGRHPLDHYNGYTEIKGRKEIKVPGLAPALPDFGAAVTDAVTLPEVLGRFVIQDDQVHDTTRAVLACNLGPLGRGQSRNFIHFASEIPEEAVRHAACMG
jgi:hypothetical protein